MSAYEDVKEAILESSSVASIHGVPLKWKEGRRGFFPISTCICVTEPCPCDKMDDVIIWLPSGSEGEKTGAKYNGQEVLSYAISPETRVLVETHIPMTVSGLKKIQRATIESDCNPRSGIRLLAKGAPLPPGSGTGFFLSVAAAAGWKVGEWIDEEAGLSDKISDYLADKIPWPW